MSEQLTLEQEARARTTDPATSHAAAASVRDLTDRQEWILRLLRASGPGEDQAIIGRYETWRRMRPEIPAQSESGIRTRRKELVERGLVVDTGIRVRLESGRQSIVWRAAE